MRLWLLAAMLALSGCVSLGDDRDELSPSFPPPASSSRWSGESFHWATSDLTGPTVLAVDFRFLEPSKCHVCGHILSEDPSSGPGAMTILLRGLDFSGRSHDLGQRGSASVHSDDVDTRSSGTTADGGSGGFGGTFSGDMTFLLAGHDVKRPASDGRTPLLAISMECDGPFDVLGARVGHELLVSNFASLSGGTGASVGPVVATQGDFAQIEMRSAEVLAGYWGALTDDVSEVSLTHPAGMRTWATGEQQPLLRGGPGTYRFETTGSSGPAGPEVMLALGLDGAYDVAAGLRDASAVA